MRNVDIQDNVCGRSCLSICNGRERMRTKNEETTSTSRKKQKASIFSSEP